MPLLRPRQDEAKRAFIARFMANPSMRSEFPSASQRRAVAEKQWNSIRKALHDLTVRACRCLKQDIPEVEAVIAALVPRLEHWWVEAIEETLRRGDLLLGVEELLAAPLPEITRLLGRTPDRRSREEIEAELSRLLVRHIEEAVSSLPARLAQKVAEERDNLLLDAALALGLSLEVETIARLEANLGPLRAAAVADLETLMAGRVASRQAAVAQAVQRYVRAVRSPSAGAGGTTARAVAQGLREELRAILGAANPRQWISFVADQWGYRWFNIGQFMSARDAGFTLFRAFNNPPLGPDNKTTAFCRNIHGRLIDVVRIENQIRQHVRAALAGNIGALMQNWPLLDRDLVTDTGPGAAVRHNLAFRSVGLPPYHARCRTVAQPVRIARP